MPRLSVSLFSLPSLGPLFEKSVCNASAARILILRRWLHTVLAVSGRGLVLSIVHVTPRLILHVNCQNLPKFLYAFLSHALFFPSLFFLASFNIFLWCAHYLTSITQDFTILAFFDSAPLFLRDGASSFNANYRID
jgi:hypothetical protein